MVAKIKKQFSRRDFLKLFGFGLAGAVALEAVDLTTENKVTKFIKEITIGFEGTVEAATADYVCDGTDDDVQWQAALDALPAGGGKLVALAGNYSFGATVSRAIDNVTIEGTGYGSYFAYNGSTALFSIGSQNKWTFRDLRIDAGGITTASASDWIFDNVYIGSDYYAGGGDIDAKNFTYVIDEDDMASNLDTKVPTQQSVKAYVDGIKTITAVLSQTLAENDSLKLDAALSADGKYNGITETGTLGDTAIFGNCLYQDSANDKWKLAKADAEATTKGRIGLCLVAGDDTDTTRILLIGKVRADAAFPAFTKYAPVFIDPSTAGDLTNTAPSTTGQIIRCVGQAISADELWFCPSNDWFEHV